MMRTSIGRVVAIDNLSIKVELFEKYISSYTISEGSPIRIGGVGNIVTCSHFVYQIVSENIVEMKENYVFEKRVINCQILGYIKHGEYFEGTDGDTPNIYDIVYMADEDILKRVYSNVAAEINATIGYYTMMQNIKFEFDIDSVFASHILIVGNTGSGKSNTVAKIYESLFDIDELDFKKSKFLVIDTNGEFGDSFTSDDNLKKIIDASDEIDGLKIPIQYIDEDNWGLILDATEKTQFPVIKSVMKKLKNMFEGKISVNSVVTDYINYCIKTIISSPVQPNQRLLTLEKIVNSQNEILDVDGCNLFMNTLGKYTINNGRITDESVSSFVDLSKNLEDELCAISLFNKSKFDVYTFSYLLHLEYLIRVYKYNVIDNNISPMMSRMANKTDLLNKHLIPFYGATKKITEFIDDLFENKPLLIVNMESCPKELKTLFVSLLAEKIYVYAVKKKKRRGRGTYHLIIEEAHNFLSKKDTSKEDALYDNCLNLFEKIIKEGRKYGLFMTISTQRPSEITETIISQTHNFFIHKLVNPKDVMIIKSAVPFIDEMSYKMLPILSPGQCIVTGTAFKRPNLVQIDMPVNEVHSQTIKLSKIWRRNKC